MWTVIIFAVLGLILTIAIEIHDEDFSMLVISMGTVCMSVIGILLVAIISIIATRFPIYTEFQTESKPIYSLADFSTTSEEFVLGTGSYKEELRYYFVVETEDGFSQIQYSNMNTTKIKESNEKPHTYEVRMKIKDKYNWLKKFLFLDESTYQSTRLIVPENTIKKQYYIDLEG